MSAIRESLGIPGLPETEDPMSKAYHLDGKSLIAHHVLPNYQVLQSAKKTLMSKCLLRRW